MRRSCRPAEVRESPSLVGYATVETPEPQVPDSTRITPSDRSDTQRGGYARRGPVIGGRHVSRYFFDPAPRVGRIALSYTDWRLLTGCLVYAWVDRTTFLYVGMTTRGFKRILQPDHHALNGPLPWPRPRHGMRLYLWPMDDAKAARLLEAKLLRLHGPMMNRTGTRPLSARYLDDEERKPGEPILASANRRFQKLARLGMLHKARPFLRTARVAR